MSWNARRYEPGKPILRAVRHRKKIFSREREAAESHSLPTQTEIDHAVCFANDHKLHRLAAMLILASNFEVVLKDRDHAMRACDEMEIECANWKFKYLQTLQRVRGLEAKIGSLRQSRQNSRTRMRAAALPTPAISPGSKRSNLRRKPLPTRLMWGR